jgi:hypothetical protein
MCDCVLSSSIWTVRPIFVQYPHYNQRRLTLLRLILISLPYLQFEPSIRTELYLSWTCGSVIFHVQIICVATSHIVILTLRHKIRLYSSVTWVRQFWFSSNKQTNSVALSPRANYTDWGTATCRRNLVSTFVDRGVSRRQRGGSPTVVNLSFLDRCRYFSFK